MSSIPRIFCVVTVQPNFMEFVPIMAETRKRGRLDAILAHDSQHYDSNMADGFFRDLD